MSDLATLKEQLASVIRSYHQWGWSPATSTNYSFRTAQIPDVIHISRSGIDKSNFSADDFMQVTLQGTPLPAYATVRPSAETRIHCTLYQLFPETQYILHSHSVYSVLHSASAQQQVVLEGYEMLKGFTGINTHQSRIAIPIFSNSQDMQAFQNTMLQNAQRLTIPAFIISKHGTYAWGKTLLEAKRHLETIEYLLEVSWQLR